MELTRRTWIGAAAAATLRAQLGVTSTAKKGSLGWELQPSSGPDLLSFSCAGHGLAIAGSVIGVVGKDDKMSSASSLAFATKKGEQQPGGFVGGSATKLVLVSGKEATFALTLTMSTTLAGEEPLELRASD